MSTHTIRILLINPNSTSTMTTSCLDTVGPSLPDNVIVEGFTAPKPAPTAIESQVDNVLSSAAAFRAIVERESQHPHDAILVACYSNHHLIRMLKEEFDVPVIGIMEASLFAAKTLGSRIGIVATAGRSAIAHWDSVRRYGFADSCAGIRACELGVLDLERLPREQVLTRMADVAKQLVEVDGADVLALGCAGMTEMKEAVEEAVGAMGVQVVDGVVAGVHHLIGIVRMGGKTAKTGVHRSSAVAREKRGQEYV